MRTYNNHVQRKLSVEAWAERRGTCAHGYISRAAILIQSCKRLSSGHHRRTICKDALHEKVQFNDGKEFAPIINGTWQLAGGHGRAVFDHVFDRLEPLAKAGFTSFDTADIYGPSEEILGQLQARWTADGKPPLQIFTKYVPNPKGGPPSYAAVKEAINKSRRSLQVQQLDLVQLHWWDYSVNGLMDVIKSLGDLQAQGMLKSIGVTNMDTVHLERITDSDVPIVSNQVQCSIIDRRALGRNGVIKLCRERGLKLLCYGVVAGGLLTNRYLERGNSPLFGQTKYRPVDLDTVSLKMYWNNLRVFGGESAWRRLLYALKEVADKHHTSIACVAINWVMSQEGGGIAYPIIGVRGAQHIQDNAKALELSLEEEDLDYIAEELKRSNELPGDIYGLERNRWQIP